MADDRITGWQFLTIWMIFTLSGAAVGVPIAIHDGMHGVSGATAVLMAIVSPILAILAAVLFAGVGALIASIPLLLMQRWMGRASSTAWTCAGALVGALVGAFHPFVILSALSNYFGGDPYGSLRLAAITCAGGGLGGFVVGWWYRTWVLNFQAAAAARIVG
jgi:hypothetical protein